MRDPIDGNEKLMRSMLLSNEEFFQEIANAHYRNRRGDFEKDRRDVSVLVQQLVIAIEEACLFQDMEEDEKMAAEDVAVDDVSEEDDVLKEEVVEVVKDEFVDESREGVACDVDEKQSSDGGNHLVPAWCQREIPMDVIVGAARVRQLGVLASGEQLTDDDMKMKDQDVVVVLENVYGADKNDDNVECGGGVDGDLLSDGTSMSDVCGGVDVGISDVDSNDCIMEGDEVIKDHGIVMYADMVVAEALQCDKVVVGQNITDRDCVDERIDDADQAFFDDVRYDLCAASDEVIRRSGVILCDCNLTRDVVREVVPDSVVATDFRFGFDSMNDFPRRKKKRVEPSRLRYVGKKSAIMSFGYGISVIEDESDNLVEEVVDKVVESATMAFGLAEGEKLPKRRKSVGAVEPTPVLMSFGYDVKPSDRGLIVETDLGERILVTSYGIDVPSAVVTVSSDEESVIVTSTLGDVRVHDFEDCGLGLDFENEIRHDVVVSPFQVLTMEVEDAAELRMHNYKPGLGAEITAVFDKTDLLETSVFVYGDCQSSFAFETMVGSICQVIDVTSLRSRARLRRSVLSLVALSENGSMTTSVRLRAAKMLRDLSAVVDGVYPEIDDIAELIAVEEIDDYLGEMTEISVYHYGRFLNERKSNIHTFSDILLIIDHSVLDYSLRQVINEMLRNDATKVLGFIYFDVSMLENRCGNIGSELYWYVDGVFLYIRSVCDKRYVMKYNRAEYLDFMRPARFRYRHKNYKKNFRKLTDVVWVYEIETFDFGWVDEDLDGVRYDIPIENFAEVFRQDFVLKNAID